MICLYIERCLCSLRVFRELVQSLINILILSSYYVAALAHECVFPNIQNTIRNFKKIEAIDTLLASKTEIKLRSRSQARMRKEKDCEASLPDIKKKLIAHRISALASDSGNTMTTRQEKGKRDQYEERKNQGS